MKRKDAFIACALLIVFSTWVNPLFGQDGETIGDLKFGVKAGFNTNFLSQDQPHIGFSPGYHAGIFANYSFSSTLGLQTELQYLQQGGQFSILYSDYRFDGSTTPFPFRVEDAYLQMHNLDFQLLADLSLASVIDGLSVRLGPAFGFNLASTITAEITAPTGDIFVTYSDTRDFTGSTPFFQLGAIGGIGTTMPAGPVDLILDVYYRYGIMTAVEGHSYINYANVVSDLTAHSIILSLGVAF